MSEENKNRPIWQIDSTHPELVDKVTDAMREIVDPEIGLNIIQRMSGIATTTARIMESVKGSDVKVAATRKVQFGSLDKRAVEDGGAYSHRLGLYESFLIKDNHLEMLKKLGAKDPLKEAIGVAFKARELSHFIEIEAKTKE